MDGNQIQILFGLKRDCSDLFPATLSVFLSVPGVPLESTFIRCLFH